MRRRGSPGLRGGRRLSAPVIRAARLAGRPIAVADRQPTFWARVEVGAWEPHTLAAIREEAAPGTWFLDVGAWVGATAMLAAVCGARVIALEPDPVARDQLAANLAANPDLEALVTVLPRALSAGSGPVRIGPARKPGDSMASVLHGAAPGAWTADAIGVEQVAGLLPPGAPVLAKVDIEGAEYDAAADLAALAAGRRLTLLLSLHPALMAAALGEAALAAANERLATAFAGYAAERAAADAWQPAGRFDPGGAGLTASDWRLRAP